MDRDQAYAVLGLAPGATRGEIRRAFRRLMLDHHPDHAGAGHAAAAARINEAYATLDAPGDAGAPADAPGATSETGAAANDAVGSRVEQAAASAGAGRARGSTGGAGPISGDAATSPVVQVSDDTIALDAAVEDAFLALLDAAGELGYTSYVDPDVGLLETIVNFPEMPTCSLVVSLQGRADHVDAFCTIEALEGGAAPPISAVVAALAARANEWFGG